MILPIIYGAVVDISSKYAGKSINTSLTMEHNHMIPRFLYPGGHCTADITY